MKLIQPLLEDNITLEIKIDKVLEDFYSAYQHIKLVQSNLFGKMLLLDNEIQFAELDQFIYHEMFCFPPLMSHKNPRTALIIGGGDLLLAKQVLKYPNIQAIDLVELDPDVLKVCKKHLGYLVGDVAKNPKLSINVEDGFEFVANSNNFYDLIYLDLTGDKEICDTIYSADFYELLIQNCMDTGGIVATQTDYGGCFYLSDRLKKLELISSPENEKESIQFLRLFNEYFNYAHQYSQFVPTFFGDWSFTMGSEGVDFKKVQHKSIEKKFKTLLEETLYYSPEYHQSVFIQPKLVKAIHSRIIG